MSPVINTINVLQQGTGQSYLPKQSVIEIEVNFSTTGNVPANFLVELSLDNGSSWHTATLHAAANGLNVVPPSIFGQSMILIDVAQTWTNLSLTPGNYGSAKVRLTATASSLNSTPFVSAQTCTIKSTLPVVTFLSMTNWIGQQQAFNAPVTLNATDDTGGGQVAISDFTHLARWSLNASDVGPGTSLPFNAYATTEDVNVANGNTGPITIYFRVYDQYYNASALASVQTNLQLTSPSNCIVKITGTQNNQDYTGVTINSDGTFTPNRAVTVNVACTSTTVGIPLSFQILSSSNVEQRANIGVNYSLIPINAQQTLYLTTNPSNPTADNFNADATCTISVTFSDAAGNSTTVNQTIRLNTRVYQTTFKPLRHASGAYTPKLHYISSGGVDTSIPQQMILANNPIRTWPDIFYPATHAYPVDVNGNLDTNFIRADSNLINMIPTAQYDPVIITLGTGNVVTPVLDSEGRPITTNWTRDGSKNYLNMESSLAGSPNYWVIDNTGYADFPLAFEFFDLDTGLYGPPFNPQAPYKGDVLMVYNATVAGCLQLVTGANGSPTWALANSTLLVPIFAFTGTGANIVDLMTGQTVNATSQGQFISSTIVNTPKVLLMLFSDANGTASGFRLNSSINHDRIWTNYDVDETNGQIWVHLNELISDTQTRGAADNTVKRMYYDYVTNGVTFNLESGNVTFANPQAHAKVTADYSYYASLTPQSNVFLSSMDDFVDYNDVAVSVVPSGFVTCTAAQKLSLWETAGYGRMVSGFAWDKDRGIVTITPSGIGPSGNVPYNQRMTSDYFYHTYQRITSDQYGDLVFHDKVLVADLIPNFPDYTWADVKIVNEGNTTLEDLQLTFVPRGYDTDGDGNVTLTGNNVVDQVLDINRPWDIQLGTKDETYTKMAMAINTAYIWPRQCPRLGGDGNAGTSGAGAIFSTWANKVFGNVSARQTVFGRAVWILGGSSGSGYPSAITAGQKRCSIEAQGKYYSSFVL